MAIRLARYSSSLTAIASAGDTTLRVAAAPSIPAFVPGDHVNLTVVSGQNLEVVRCTAFDSNANTLTVVRGASGTTPLRWEAGAMVVLSNDPLTIQEYVAENGGSGRGVDPRSDRVLRARGRVVGRSCRARHFRHHGRRARRSPAPRRNRGQAHVVRPVRRQGLRRHQRSRGRHQPHGRPRDRSRRSGRQVHERRKDKAHGHRSRREGRSIGRRGSR